MLSTSRYKNKTALIAWLCVEADTLRSLTIMDIHVSPVAHAAGLCRTPAHKKAHPVKVCLLSVVAIVQVTIPLTNLFEQAG